MNPDKAGRTIFDISFMSAFRLGKRNPTAGMRQFSVLRRRALRAGRKQDATRCLVQMRFLAALLDDPQRELRILKQIVREAPEAHHFVALGAVLEMRGNSEGAIKAFRKALETQPTSTSWQEAVFDAKQALVRLERMRTNKAE